MRGKESKLELREGPNTEVLTHEVDTGTSSHIPPTATIISGLICTCLPNAVDVGCLNPHLHLTVLSLGPIYCTAISSAQGTLTPWFLPCLLFTDKCPKQSTPPSRYMLNAIFPSVLWLRKPSAQEAVF